MQLLQLLITPSLKLLRVATQLAGVCGTTTVSMLYELDADGAAVFAEIAGDDGSFTASRNTTFVEAESKALM